MTSFSDQAEALRARIERHVLSVIPPEPHTLYMPVRRTLEAGGKRVRPLLTALCAEVSGSEEWLHAAAAVELLHTFTLVHDDIMDNAASRRGRPTMHVAHGVNAAILSGDVLIALAMEEIAKSESPNVSRTIAEFARAFRLVCEGQALDKEFETRDDISVEEYLRMIDLKTSRVLELAAVLGALSGDARHIESLRTFAHHLGLAFQISDDLLDLTGDEASFGKSIGGDIVEGKRTLLFVLATEYSAGMAGADRELLNRIRDRSASASDVPSARDLFDRLGVLDEASRMAADQTRLAKNALEGIQPRADIALLRDFSDYLLRRSN